MFKPNPPSLFLSILLLFLAAGCNSKTGKNDAQSGNVSNLENKEAATPIDSVLVVRDTVVVLDTINVVDKQVFVSADKMKVLYIGVDNPITIHAPGIPSESVTVRSSQINLKKVGPLEYIATVERPSIKSSIFVSGEGLSPTTFDYQVKRIPDPVARLSRSSGGMMGNGEFKAQGGIGAFLDNFDFDAKCNIQGFNLVYVARNQDPIESNNKGPRYNEKSKQMIKRARPGDYYFFENVRAKCPGDQAARKINSMVFKIR